MENCDLMIPSRYIYNRRSYLVCEVSVRKECHSICFGSRPRGNSICDRAARQKFASPVMRRKVGRAALDIYESIAFYHYDVGFQDH